MATRKDVVPWIDKNEFEKVYMEVFSNNPALQSHAVGRLAVWKCRIPSERDLYSFIVCTLELLSVKLLDTGIDDVQLRLAYSMAIIRFVNLMSENLEKTENRERSYGQSVVVNGHQQHRLLTLRDKRKTLRTFAERLGIPQWLVDTRHAATHTKSLPSVEQLHRAVEFAFQFMQETCWKPYLRNRTNLLDDYSYDGDKVEDDDDDDDDDAYVCDNEVNKQIYDCLQQYVKHHINTAKGSVKRRKGFGSVVADLLLRLEAAAKTHSGSLISALVTHDFGLISSPDVLISLRVKHRQLTRQSEAVIPSALVKLWQPVLYLLNKLHLTTHLLHSLACGLTEEGHLCDCLSVGWIARILAAIANSKNGNTARFYYLRPCRVIGRQLLQLVLRSPNKYTTGLIKRIFPLCVPALSQSARNHLLQLVLCYTSAADDNLDEECCSAYDINSVADDDDAVDVTKQALQPSQQHRWTIVNSGVNWTLYPIGCHYRNPQIGYTSLELPTEVDRIDLPEDRWSENISAHVRTAETDSRANVNCVDTNNSRYNTPVVNSRRDNDIQHCLHRLLSFG